jgi:hypothetical protein
MKLVRDIDVFSDEQLRRRMATVSAVVLGAGAVLITVWCLVGGVDFSLETPGRIALGFVIGAVATYVAFLVHELVHGLFFKLLAGPGQKIEFGYKDGMLYTRAPGCRLAVGKFMAVLLAPTVLVSAAIALAGLFTGRAFLAAIVFVLHLSGCSGDSCMANTIAMTPDVDLCEDTATGVECWSFDDNAHAYLS